MTEYMCSWKVNEVTDSLCVCVCVQVMYLRVRRSHYIAARRAYLLEQVQKEPHGEEHFEKEIVKVSVQM